MFILMIKLAMLAFAVNIVLVPWGGTITRWSGYATILFSYFTPCMLFRTDFRMKLQGEKKAFFYLSVVLCSSVALSLAEGKIDTDLIRDILAFFCMYWALSIEPQTYTKKDLMHLFIINQILSLILIAYSLGPFPFKYTITDEWGNTAFTLGMGNPNGTALNIMFCIAMLVIDICYENKLLVKIIKLSMVAILLYDVVLLASRTVLACSLLIIAMIWLKRMPLKAWYADIAVIIPIVFIFFQIWIGDKEDVLVLGKTIASGRQNAYTRFLNEIMSNPLKYIWGAIGENRLENAHNAPFAMVLNLGFLGAGAYVAFWRSLLKAGIRNNAGDTVRKVAIIVLIAYVVYSSTEAGPMLGMILYSTPLLVIGRLVKDEFVNVGTPPQMWKERTL